MTVKTIERLEGRAGVVYVDDGKMLVRTTDGRSRWLPAVGDAPIATATTMPDRVTAPTKAAKPETAYSILDIARAAGATDPELFIVPRPHDPSCTSLVEDGNVAALERSSYCDDCVDGRAESVDHLLPQERAAPWPRRYRPGLGRGEALRLVVGAEDDDRRIAQAIADATPLGEPYPWVGAEEYACKVAGGHVVFVRLDRRLRWADVVDGDVLFDRGACDAEPAYLVRLDGRGMWIESEADRLLDTPQQWSSRVVVDAVDGATAPDAVVVARVDGHPGLT